jgi:hypothetical protein
MLEKSGVYVLSNTFLSPCFIMSRIVSSEVFEAENLLEEVDSWSDEEIEELPKFYREKAREFRGLTNSGEE